MTTNVPSLPTNLPVPKDDGACAHLTGFQIPSIPLRSTSDEMIDLASLEGLQILFTYPRTAAPNEVIPDEWNAIPGARGCSPQACSFRDEMAELKALGVTYVFGLSTQDTAYQQEAKSRLHLSYDLLSDENLEFVKGLKLPTFRWQGGTLVKRTVMVIEGGRIVKVFYPVFPSDASARMAKEWLRERKNS